MLVGLKTHTDAAGNLVWPAWVNRGLDTDVVVSEVRETSRKPDEVYGLIERMCPGGRKIEIFGRRHNTRPGYARGCLEETWCADAWDRWLTLGNQLGQDQIHEPDLAERLRERYASSQSLRSARNAQHCPGILSVRRAHWLEALRVLLP
jgi:mRNA (2'-O-methyladenosine-N6-)-methyltransferase